MHFSQNLDFWKSAVNIFVSNCPLDLKLSGNLYLVIIEVLNYRIWYLISKSQDMGDTRWCIGPKFAQNIVFVISWSISHIILILAQGLHTLVKNRWSKFQVQSFAIRRVISSRNFNDFSVPRTENRAQFFLSHFSTYSPLKQTYVSFWIIWHH